MRTFWQGCRRPADPAGLLVARPWLGTSPGATSLSAVGVAGLILRLMALDPGRTSPSATTPSPHPSGFRPRIGVRGMLSIAGMTRD